MLQRCAGQSYFYIHWNHGRAISVRWERNLQEMLFPPKSPQGPQAIGYTAHLIFHLMDVAQGINGIHSETHLVGYERKGNTIGHDSCLAHLTFPGRVPRDIECSSKQNGLPKCRNKEFIFAKTHLLALFSKKLRRLKYGLRSQDPCSKYTHFSLSPSEGLIGCDLPPMHGKGFLGSHILEYSHSICRGGMQI
jgi:hypothetical protein